MMLTTNNPATINTEIQQDEDTIFGLTYLCVAIIGATLCGIVMICFCIYVILTRNKMKKLKQRMTDKNTPQKISRVKTNDSEITEIQTASPISVTSANTYPNHTPISECHEANECADIDHTLPLNASNASIKSAPQMSNTNDTTKTYYHNYNHKLTLNSLRPHSAFMQPNSNNYNANYMNPPLQLARAISQPRPQHMQHTQPQPQPQPQTRTQTYYHTQPMAYSHSHNASQLVMSDNTYRPVMMHVYAYSDKPPHAQTQVKKTDRVQQDEFESTSDSSHSSDSTSYSSTASTIVTTDLDTCSNNTNKSQSTNEDDNYMDYNVMRPIKLNRNENANDSKTQNIESILSEICGIQENNSEQSCDNNEESVYLSDTKRNESNEDIMEEAMDTEDIIDEHTVSKQSIKIEIIAKEFKQERKLTHKLINEQFSAQDEFMREMAALSQQ